MMIKASNGNGNSLALWGELAEKDSLDPFPLESRATGLAVLLQAHGCAREFQRDPWDFAVEIAQLRQSGLTVNDVRWLTCKGYVEHACEVTRPDAKKREFQAAGNLLLSERTCFVLTEAGVDYARRLCTTPWPTRRQDPRDRHAGSSCRGDAAPNVPRWDGDLRELRVGATLIKRFRLRSPNQESLLTAFEEESWPARIDDPLTPRPDCDPKERLRDTIRSLNRNQKNSLIRFKGDGTGEGVLWEWADDDLPAEIQPAVQIPLEFAAALAAPEEMELCESRCG